MSSLREQFGAMSQPRPIYNNYADPQLSSYNSTQSSSSSTRQPATPINNTVAQDLMPDIHAPENVAMAPMQTGEGTEMFSADRVVNIDRWMASAAPQYDSGHEKARDIINGINKVLFPPMTLNEVGSDAAGLSAQAKRRRADSPQPSSNNDPKKKRAPLLITPPASQPLYARAIPQEIRALVDDDFDAGCEWCPFYLHEPLSFFNKPWNSCGKQRAEISHIITHIVSDHGKVRGRNTKRSSQRYLTQCASHDSKKKGKSDCTTCSRVELWTEDELRDERHSGPAVCLRCYEPLASKLDLYHHLQQPSICLYQEDLPMRKKARILYTVFCSDSEVPKFRPPPDASAPRNGARKRNMKGGRRVTAESRQAAQNSNARSTQRAVQPSLRPTPSPHLPSLSLSPMSQRSPHPEVSEDFTTNFYPSNSSPQSLQTTSTLHTTPQAYSETYLQPYVRRQPLPSDYGSEVNLGQPYQNFTPLPDDFGLLSPHSTSIDNGYLLSAAMPMSAKYPPAYDSGIGSEMSGIQSQQAGEDNCPPDDTYNNSNHIPMNPMDSFFNEACFEYTAGGHEGTIGPAALWGNNNNSSTWN